MVKKSKPGREKDNYLLVETKMDKERTARQDYKAPFSKWSPRFRFKRTTHRTGEGEKKQTLTVEAGSLFARSKSGVLSAVNPLPTD